MITIQFNKIIYKIFNNLLLNLNNLKFKKKIKINKKNKHLINNNHKKHNLMMILMMILEILLNQKNQVLYNKIKNNKNNNRIQEIFLLMDLIFQ